MNTTNRRLSLHALVLAAGLALGNMPALAGTPSDAEIGDCVAKAERYFASDSLEVRDADLFRNGNGRRVLAINVELEKGVKPRFYCVLEADGRISQVKTLPRLPGHDAAMLVSK